MESIGLIGVGKLGLSLALILEEAGYKTICFDKSESQKNNIKNKTLITVEPYIETMLQKSSNLVVVDSLQSIYTLPVSFIIVLTPSLSNGSYDHSAVDDIVNMLIIIIFAVDVFANIAKNEGGQPQQGQQPQQMH
jgi:UDP-glucose 6-dehydrogenase